MTLLSNRPDQGCAPAGFAVTASPVLRIEPQSALRLDPDARVPTGAEQSPILFRHEAAKRDLARWYEAEWQKLLAERSAREREIERKFWNGEYSHG